MKRIIDIPDEMYDDIKHGYICSEYADTLIQLIPSSKPYEERPQGEWLEKEVPIYYTDDEVETVYICPKCGYENFEKSNFCPNCGAKMKGGKE